MQHNKSCDGCGAKERNVRGGRNKAGINAWNIGFAGKALRVWKRVAGA